MPDDALSGLCGPALHEQHVSAVVVGIQHGKLSLARLGHGLATGTLNRVAWLWHGSALSSHFVKGQQVSGSADAVRHGTTSLHSAS